MAGESLNTTVTTCYGDSIPIDRFRDDIWLHTRGGRPEARINVDYLEHDWNEEDLWRSWRAVTCGDGGHALWQRSRLENASWRMWGRRKFGGGRLQPEKLNWLKDSEVTWLHGPLYSTEHPEHRKNQFSRLRRASYILSLSPSALRRGRWRSPRSQSRPRLALPPLHESFDLDAPESARALQPLSSTLSDRIPQDVVDSALEHLIGSMGSLYACALVCRLWYHRSSTLLYKDIVINRAQDFYLLADGAKHSLRVRDYLLRTETLFVSDLGNAPCSQVVPHVFGKFMCYLGSLTFSGSSWKAIHPSFPFLLSQFSSVVNLKFRYIKFNNFSDLRRLICALPSLTHLRVDGCSLKQYNRLPRQNQSSRMKSCPSLQTLCLGEVNTQLVETLAWWFKVSGSAQSLRMVDFTKSVKSTEADVSALERFLEAVGRRLVALRIACPYVTGMHRCLRHAAELRSLEFPLPNRLYVSRRIANELGTIVGSIGSDRLQSLTFVQAHGGVLRRDDEYVVSSEDVASAGQDDSVPSFRITKRFPALQTFQIQLSPVSTPDLESVDLPGWLRGLFIDWKDVAPVVDYA